MDLIKQLRTKSNGEVTAEGKSDSSPGDTVIVQLQVVEVSAAASRPMRECASGRRRRRHQREFHGAPEFLWRGRRARIPALLADGSTRSKSCAPRQRCAAPRCTTCEACAANSPRITRSRNASHGADAAVSAAKD